MLSASSIHKEESGCGIVKTIQAKLEGRPISRLMEVGKIGVTIMAESRSDFRLSPQAELGCHLMKNH